MRSCNHSLMIFIDISDISGKSRKLLRPAPTRMQPKNSQYLSHPCHFQIDHFRKRFGKSRICSFAVKCNLVHDVFDDGLDRRHYEHFCYRYFSFINEDTVRR